MICGYKIILGSYIFVSIDDWSFWITNIIITLYGNIYDCRVLIVVDDK